MKTVPGHRIHAACAALLLVCAFSPTASSSPVPPAPPPGPTPEETRPDHTAALLLPARHASLDILGPDLLGTCAPQQHDYLARCQAAPAVGLMDLQGRELSLTPTVRVEHRTEKILILATSKDPARPGQPVKWGLITPDGRFLVRPIWSRLQFLSDSALAYELDTTCPSPTPGAPPVPCRKTGIFNVDLRRTFPADFDWILPDVRAPYAARKSGNLYGYIDDRGRTVVPFNLMSASRCSEGWCRTTRGNNTVYFDPEGRDLLTVAKTLMDDFHQGLALLQTSEWKRGFIDTTGRLAIRALYSDARDFHEGLASVKIGDRWGYIDRSGKTVVPFKWTETEDFDDGFARVVQETFDSKGNATSTRTAFLNARGKVVWRGTGSLFHYVEEGLLLVTDQDRTLYGVIDPVRGRLVVPRKYLQVSSCGPGLIVVGDGAKQAGLLDRTGAELFPVAGRTVECNRVGVIVSTGGSRPVFHLFDATGRKRITKADYDELAGWHHVPTLGTFRRGAVGGLIDAQGRERCTIPGASAGSPVTNATPTLEHRYYKRHSTAAFRHEFAREGLVKFQVNGKWGLYDFHCREVSPPSWEAIGMMRHNLVPVKLGGKWGLLKITPRPTATSHGRGQVR